MYGMSNPMSMGGISMMPVHSRAASTMGIPGESTVYYPNSAPTAGAGASSQSRGGNPYGNSMSSYYAGGNDLHVRVPNASSAPPVYPSSTGYSNTYSRMSSSDSSNPNSPYLSNADAVSTELSAFLAGSF